MRFICVYIDLMNPAIKFKAVIEADFMQLEEVESEGSNFINFYKKNIHGKDVSTLVFSMHEGRVIHAYCESNTSIYEIEKGKTGVKPFIRSIKQADIEVDIEE